MSEQYFEAQPNAAHHYQQFDFELLGHALSFKTDAGVFSKATIDYGSRVMMDAAAKRMSTLPKGPLLDLGTGYGPVGIAFSKVFQRSVDMVDVNERAVNLAIENTKRNSVDDLTHVFISDRYEEIQRSYAAILVNPPIRAGKKIVTEMLVEAKKHLLPGGKLFAVLQKKQGAPSAEKNILTAFGNVEIIEKSKGYFIFEAVNDATE